MVEIENERNGKKMNQARKRPMLQKVLSMILVLVMLLGLLSVSAFTMADSQSSADTADSTEFMRIFHLDCGRKYFSVSEIEGIIDQLAANHYTHLQLAFGNDGLRFLLNDMSVSVNGTDYVSDRVTSAIKQGNQKLTSGSSGELSESNMDDIISYANDKGIQIIPMFNAPGHMYTVVSAMSSLKMDGKSINVSSPTDARTSNVAVDPTDTTAVSFAKALLQKYVTYFAQKGSTMFNIGADESGISTSNYAAYAAMVNDMNAIVKKANMTTLAYNDGIYNTSYAASQPDVKFDKDIVICYWTSGANSASVESLLDKGFKILNNSDNWYYVLGDYLYTAWGSNGQWGYNDALNGIKSTSVTQMKGYTGTEKPVGSVLCVWCDAPNQTYDSSKVYALIKAMADANPTYFTDIVKLPASDASANVSVEVLGKKGETASLNAETITSNYTFDAENVSSYNVTPKVEGKSYTGKGTVTLPVPTDWVQDASRIRAYVIDNGAVKVISGKLSDGMYTFEVPHFSEMGLLQVGENAAIPITVTVGQTLDAPEPLHGDQTSNISKGDSSLVTVNAVYNQTAQKELKKITSANDLKSGDKYLIVNQRMAQGSGNTTQLLTNKTTGTSGWANCLVLSGKPEATSTDFWTITESNGSYTVKYGDTGEYLNISSSAANVGSKKLLTLSCEENSESDGYPTKYWNISCDGYYLNNLGGEVGAGGWKNDDAPKDAGSRWSIYRVVDKAAADTTTVSFTGVKVGGPTYVTVGDTTYKITVTEKQAVEIPISIVDYRADGLLFDYDYNGNSYAYGLVHDRTGAGNVSSVSTALGTKLDGATYGTKISGTTLERTRTGGLSYWSDSALDNSWSRAGLVESELGSNGMPVYTKATVEYVAGLLSSGNYNAMSGSCNAVLQNTFLDSGAPRSVLKTSTTAFSEAFAGTKSYDNITTAYDLAWYLLNTIYQSDTNMTTVTGTDGAEHNVPIYGMKVDAYKSIILTDNGDGTYSFNAGYSGNTKNVLYDRTSGTISESDSGESTTGFYPINGLGYEQAGLLTKTSAINDGADNGSFTLRGQSQFVYNKSSDLYFTFTGDDDVYMYINGKLAMDLGGAHGRNTKTVKLNDLNAEEYGLVDGQIATFTFFYMERCSDASTFGIETNMELVKPGISVAKKAYDDGYVNEIADGMAIENGRTIYYDLIVTNQSNIAMSKISFADKDSLNGTANFGDGVANASVSAGTKNADGTVLLKDSGNYVIYVTDASEAEVSGTRQTLTSLDELSRTVAGVTLQPGQSLHVRFLSAEFNVDNAKILDYENDVNVKATVGGQSLSASATHELYSYNAGDTSRTYVVDFGLPLQIENIFDKGVKDQVSYVKISNANTQKYGTVELNSDGYNTSLVYTRTADKTINDAETIVLDVTYLMGNNKVTLQKTLTIIPATTVYYEDSLATFVNADKSTGIGKGEDNGFWTTDGTTQTDAKQALEALGSKENVYGYDDAYANSSTFSMGSATKVTVDANTADNGQWPTAAFTFRGTGFDVISLTNSDAGTVVYTVTNKTTGKSESHIINNYYGYVYEDGQWVVKNNDTTAPYQVPVIKVSGLDYDTYEVKISVVYGAAFDKTGDNQYSFWLDAIRVYDPAGSTLDSEYAKDGENAPNYVEVKRVLLDTKALESENAVGAVFIDGKGSNGVTAADYANQGPNHEAYLAKDQAIAFQLIANGEPSSVQLGAKLANGTSADLRITGASCDKASNDLLTLKTATDMYYKLTDLKWTLQEDGLYKSNVITLTNTSDDIVSLTNVKFIDATYSRALPSAKNSDADTTVVTFTASAAMVEEAISAVDGVLNPALQVFTPSRFEASWGHSVRKGDTATLTVKTSEDVKSITVDGQPLTAYTLKTERTGWGWWAKTVTYREFTYTDTAVATKNYTVCAVNSDGVSSDPIATTLTVRPSVRDWWHGIFDKWF